MRPLPGGAAAAGGADARDRKGPEETGGAGRGQNWKGDEEGQF